MVMGSSGLEEVMGLSIKGTKNEGMNSPSKSIATLPCLGSTFRLWYLNGSVIAHAAGTGAIDILPRLP